MSSPTSRGRRPYSWNKSLTRPAPSPTLEGEQLGLSDRDLELHREGDLHAIRVEETEVDGANAAERGVAAN